MENERISLPVVALRGMTILPEMVAHFDAQHQSADDIDSDLTASDFHGIYFRNCETFAEIFHEPAGVSWTC